MKVTSLVALAALIGAVQPMAAEAKDKVFALVPKAMNNPFFDQARDGCMKAAKEIGGIECLLSARLSAAEQEQVQMVQDLITKQVDGIGVSAANAPAIAKVLGRGQGGRSIPVVTWDSDLLPADKGLRADLYRHGQRPRSAKRSPSGRWRSSPMAAPIASRAADRPRPT